MKGFRTAMTVIGAAVALGIVGTAVAPVAAIAAPAARAAVVAGAVPDAWVEVSNGTHFRVMVGDHNVAPTRVDVRPVGSDVVVATLDKFWYESDTVGSEEPDIGWYEAHDELRLDGMGDYELDVYVPSDGGGVAGRKGAGRFTYALDPKLDAASDQKQFYLDDLKPVCMGETMFVAGTLKAYGLSGYSHNYPGRKVRSYFKPTGGTVWKEVGSSITRADGTFGAKFKAVSDGTWPVRHVDTDARHFASTSHTVYLDVRGGTAPCAAE